MHGSTRSLGLFGISTLLTVAAATAHAYEYPLQFTPIGNHKSLVVAGYQIVHTNIFGNCSYIRTTSGSGRDPRTFYTPINQTCTWDTFGNLLGVAAGAPAIPAPIAIVGSRTIYARQSAKLYTGSDSAEYGGFVWHTSAHFDWTTPSGYTVLNSNAPYALTASITSDGDNPLNVVSVYLKDLDGKAKVTSTTCAGSIPVGSSCTVDMTLDPSKLTSTTGLAYDTLTLKISSNAGDPTAFTEGFTIVVPIPPDSVGN